MTTQYKISLDPATPEAQQDTTANAAPYGNAQNVIDCRTTEKTIIGQYAHDLYFRGGYRETQSEENLFGVYYVPEEGTPELRACQSTLKGALKYMGAYTVLVCFKGTPRIQTSPIFPPIPIRGLDWCAHFDNYEPGQPIGHGATEKEAIEDLLSLVEEIPVRPTGNPQWDAKHLT